MTATVDPTGAPAIAMNDFRREPAELLDEQLRACERVMRSGWFILGKEVAGFEQRWAERCLTRHAVGVGNGLDALEVGLRAIGIRPGDEVVTTAMTAFATVLAIYRAGAVPVLADLDPATGLMDRASAERCIGPRTRAVMLVHLYGQVRDPSAWRAWTDERGLLLLEDCAQAHGAEWSGRPAGTFGTAGAYSFYPTKNLGARGDGGALVTDDAAVAESARRLRNYGQEDRYHHPVIGLNSRLDELQAAILSVRLGWLDRFNARRRAIAARYRAAIRNPRVMLLAPPLQEASHNHHLFVITTEDRPAFMAWLARRGIATLSHYPVPIHHQASCALIGRDPAGLDHADLHASRCCSIPCHPQMDEGEVTRVIEAIDAYR